MFGCFDVYSVRPSQIFQVQAKISTVRPVFSDYLSVSYDYGVNELLNDESQRLCAKSSGQLEANWFKCKSGGVKRILISGIIVNNELASAYISSVNQRISNMRRDNSFVFLDNNNISTSSLFRNGLYLLEIGKRVLANNFIDNLNNLIRLRKTHRPPP